MKSSVRWVVLGILMLSISVLSLSTVSSAQIGIGIGISVRIAPPALPVYAQPICPGPGYLWTPGYWSWDDDGGYYWVPGTWVVAPVGMLWTPGYWGFERGFYGWHAGYWGPHVGFYGGINYGFGYGGVGFFGGEWRGGGFFYNRAVMNVNVTNVTNVYSKTVIVNNVHTSFNGPGGVAARSTAQEEAYGREHHTEALATQREHEHAASQNHALFASANHGRPEIAATAKPGEFSGHGVEKARAAGGSYREPKVSPREARATSEANRKPEAAAKNDAARNAGHANAGHANDRPAARSENRPAQKNDARNNPVRNEPARSNEARSNPARNNSQAWRESAQSHDAAKPAKPARQVQQRTPKEAKPEPKGNTHEPHHR